MGSDTETARPVFSLVREAFLAFLFDLVGLGFVVLFLFETVFLAVLGIINK